MKKQQARERCLALVDKIREVRTVPLRVLQGPLQASTTWKQAYRDATQNYHVRHRAISTRRTLSELREIEQRLTNYLTQLS